MDTASALLVILAIVVIALVLIPAGSGDMMMTGMAGMMGSGIGPVVLLLLVVIGLLAYPFTRRYWCQP